MSSKNGGKILKPITSPSLALEGRTDRRRENQRLTRESPRAKREGKASRFKCRKVILKKEEVGEDKT